MNSYLVELDVGELSLLEAKQYLRKALTIQKQLEKAWKYYHADHGVVKSIDIIRNPMIISQWNPNFVIDDVLDMEKVRQAMASKTLHESVCCIQPPSFQQWPQVNKHLNTMSTYRSDIRNYTPDEVVLAQRRAAAVKDGATVIRRKVEQAMASPEDQNIFVIKLLQEDLQGLYVEITSTCQSGIVWSADNFGVHRDELQEWRQYSLTLYQTLAETKSKQTFVLGTEDIGFRKGAPAEVLDGVAKMFRFPPHLLSNPEGKIDLLIGLESGQLLLREVYQVDGETL